MVTYFLGRSGILTENGMRVAAPSTRMLSRLKQVVGRRTVSASQSASARDGEMNDGRRIMSHAQLCQTQTKIDKIRCMPHM